MVPVPHDERQRRTQRRAVPKPCQHLHLVALETLPRAAAVPLLPPSEVSVDLLADESQARRQPADDRDEPRPMRLPGGGQVERHTGKPTAARIASTGAGEPVQISNDAAP